MNLPILAMGRIEDVNLNKEDLAMPLIYVVIFQILDCPDTVLSHISLHAFLFYADTDRWESMGRVTSDADIETLAELTGTPVHEFLWPNQEGDVAGMGSVAPAFAELQALTC